ncbi:general substrate transporter [Aspergillus venezuelensis]
MHQADKHHVLQTAFVVFPCFFLFRYNQVVVGALVSFEAFTQLFPQLDTAHITGAVKSHRSVIQGVYVSSFTLGCAVGAFSCSFIRDRLGRRKTICTGSKFTLIGELFIGRILTGIGVGIFSTMVPVWQSESSPPAINCGRHVVDGIFITSGYAVSYWINYGVSCIQEHDVSWRVPLATPGVLSIDLCLGIFFFPESPRWLVSIGHIEKATSELARLKGLDSAGDKITREVNAIEVSLESTAQKASTYRDIFTMKDGKLFYRVFLCVGLQFWIQMTGAQVISTYSTTIFPQNLNLSDGITRILAGSALIWKFLAAFISLFTTSIDLVAGYSFLICGVGVTTCMTCMAITTSFSSSNKAAAIASTVFVFLFNFFFPIGFLGPSFLYCTGVAPLGFANFLLQRVTPFALSSIGYKYYIVYAVIGLTYIISVYLFYPETMGQSLE